MQAQAPHAGTLAKRMVCRHCAPATIKSKTSSLYIAHTMTKNVMTKLPLLAETCSMLLTQLLDFDTLTGKPHCCQKRLAKAAENSVMLRRANLWEPSLSDPIWHYQMVAVVVQCHIVLWYQSEPWMWTNRSFKISQSSFFAIAYGDVKLFQSHPALPVTIKDFEVALRFRLSESKPWTVDPGFCFFKSKNKGIQTYSNQCLIVLCCIQPLLSLSSGNKP